MNAKSMQDQVFKLRREINQLKAQNKHQINYSMDLFDDTTNNSLRGNKKSLNTSTHKSQKQFSLSNNYNQKATGKKSRASLSSVNNNNSHTNYNKNGSKYNYSHVTNSSKSSQLIKVPILRGMFSYKKSFIDEEKKSRFNNLNSLIMSQDVKLNFLDESNAFNLNDGFPGNNLKYHQSSNSIDLSKYKIISSQGSSSVIGLSHKNSMAPIEQNARNNLIESYLQVNNKPLTQLKIDNNQILSPNQGRSTNYNNSNLIQNSMQMSPVIINNINLPSNSNDFKGNENNNGIATESFAYFKEKRKNEKESRRMIIEFLKLKNHTNKEPIDSLLSAMNISYKVLEQERTTVKSPQSNSLYLLSQSQQTNNTNVSLLLKNRTKSMSSLHQMNQFMSEMNDENKERINMINYLSIPRVMSLITSQGNVAYIFVLSPNSICHLYGIETYVFKWREFKDGNNSGYFDLLKVANCTRNKANHNQFKIQIEEIDDNGNNIKTYEIEAASSEMSKNYVDCLNFLSQLIKCKVFKRIGTFSPNR